ncbi:MAG: HD domain-containing protein [Chloroflexi bacterium]|nr:HD domain-containing protein [Chloroflexota bacterium]
MARSTREDTLLGLLLATPRTTLRDSVWGSIPLFDKELLLIDTPPYQRLRRVQQLGFTSLTFPGAHHTRFEHGLGVYHLTRRVLHQLLRQDACPPLSQEDVDTVLAAALLHDVGHYPFSHAAEELEHRLIRRHEEIGYDLVTGPVIGPVLADVWRVDPVRVGRLLLPRSACSGVDALLRDLLSGSVDADKLDYLVRDARHCNVPYGLVDVERLIQAFRAWRDPMTDAPGIVLDEKGVGPMHSLIMAKYLMFHNVYWHHTVRIATVMFLRALQDALEGGLLEAGELEASDDQGLLWLLRQRAATDSSTARLVHRLTARRLYKRALGFTSQDEGYEDLVPMKRDPARRRAVEIELCRRLSSPGRPLQGDEILLDMPDERSFDLPVEVLCEVPPRGYANPVPWAVVSGLAAADLTRYQDRIRQVHVVAADAELAEVVRASGDLVVQVAAERVMSDGW